MRCPSCGKSEDRVVDSRPSDGGSAIRRRRECVACGGRFTTFERVELPELLVRKRSGHVLPFSRAKVLDGMVRAAKGRIPADTLERAAIAVESAIREQGHREIDSEQVGLQVLAQLRDLDEVTYVRYASVYKDFQDTDDFMQELSGLRKDAPPKARR
ncbi:MAG: transcriptional repressor NrdR [Nitriliruptor sp.]|nr:MAG: transcriptional repressor NrdR [Nitriliruptor sp.]